MARIIRNDFLQQQFFSMYDRYCPFYKTTWMMKNLVTFYDLAKEAILQRGLHWRHIETEVAAIHKLCEMKYLDPARGETEVTNELRKLEQEIIGWFNIPEQ